MWTWECCKQPKEIVKGFVEGPLDLSRVPEHASLTHRFGVNQSRNEEGPRSDRHVARLGICVLSTSSFLCQTCLTSLIAFRHVQC